MAAFYFRNFPLVKYSFGDNEPEVYFQKVSSFIDLFDVARQDVSFHIKQTISDNERPDTLSYKLYGTSDYYWTFFLMNDNLRESGWPLPLDREREVIVERYPNYVMTTDSFISSLFPVGAVVKHTGTGSNAIFSTVLSKNLDLGQITVQATGFEEDFVAGVPVQIPSNPATIETSMLNTTALGYVDQDDVSQVANIYRANRQYEATHHFEDSLGEYVDVNPRSTVRTGLIDVTFEERLKRKNNELKEIIVIRPGIINSLVGEFQKMIRS